MKEDKIITTRRENTIDVNGMSSTFVADVQEIIENGLRKAYKIQMLLPFILTGKWEGVL